MSERPFMQLYVSDFVGDTLLLSTENIGAYLLLLIALWNADGELPSDDVKLARVTRMSVKKWRSAAVELLPFFEVEGGKLTHNRLTKELRKSERQSELRAAAGAKGGHAKALKDKGTGVANAMAGSRHARALPEPYKKEGDFSSSQKGEGNEGVRLDRWADEDLFKACERVMGEKVPAFLQFKIFPAEVVDQAKGALGAAA